MNMMTAPQTLYRVLIVIVLLLVLLLQQRPCFVWLLFCSGPLKAVYALLRRCRDRLKFGFGFGYNAETNNIFSFSYGRNHEVRFRLLSVTAETTRFRRERKLSLLAIRYLHRSCAANDCI